uniref:Protein NPAT C-terminal domain-containing protein n=1 Tax=Periophthalmus magnuspinnatus TaxID=409849 RepID=A0A3B4AQH2_9GOBI
MLLPSDIARLVLGYLQEEGLSDTSRAFIHESPNLKEYAEHSSEDGTIPACVFSIFGKGLTTILNDYVAVKTKESNHQVPPMMSSLWKKLDFTLNQIKSLQNSPALSACQRVRSRVGLANIARQRALTNSSNGIVCSTVSETISIVSPAQTSHCILTHSTPVSCSGQHRFAPSSAPHQQSHEASRLLNTPSKYPVPCIYTFWSQLVIQNAREKILGDRSLQEKLAENINKILSRWPTPQSSKAAANMVEPDQSIDEILGLQGEIHMTDDAIHDILEQTESDPAFQALFDLFDCSKCLPFVFACINIYCILFLGTIQKEASESVSVKTKPAIERKTRKSAPLLKKTIIVPCNRSSRIENSSARLLSVMQSSEEPQGTSSSKRTEKNLYSDTVMAMDIDEPQATIAPTPTNISTTIVAPTSAPAASNRNLSLPPTTMAPVVSETPNLNGHHENKEAQGSSTQICLAYPLSSETSIASTTTVTPTISQSSKSLAPATSASPVSVSSSVSTAMPQTSVPSSSLTESTTEPTSSNKTGADPSNIMSLKIIISDNQEEDSTSDTALSQAISSISSDKIPTIYLSSPAKSPVVPGTPKGNLDEAAQAVSCLQKSEAVIASPLTGTSQPQQSYIIQLPFDGATTTAASYFLVTEPPTGDVQNRQKIVPSPVSKGQAIAPTQFDSQIQNLLVQGSAFILPSPIKPVVLPLSVMGQNTLGNVQMMSNQLVAIPSPPVVQQKDTMKSKNVVSPPAPSSGTQSVSTSSSPGHRRILCFDSSGESQTSKINTSPSASSVQPLPPKSPRTKPAILTSNKPKRRIETVRCSDSTISQQNQMETAKKGSRKQQYNVANKESGGGANIIDITKPSESSRRSSERKQNHGTEESNNREKESRTSRSLSTDSFQKSGSRKEKEATDKVKTREGRSEKRTQETTSITANKENELKGSVQEQQSAASSPTPAQPNTQSKSSKPPSKTSALAKQAAEMLQDLQALNSPSTPKGAELSSQEESGSDCPKTPTRTRKSRASEGTPRHLMPPNSSDMPTCSPASEAGSESSINMAAHTLMILSRAALARTGTPLKNSLRQEGAGEQSPTSSKMPKKRKQPTPTSSPPAKKEPKRTPRKKKERKKLVECFPQDLDVDKFLSSLHYDE